MAKIIFRLTLDDKTPSTWELPQTNVMGVKPEKGKKFINYYPGEDSCFVEDIFEKNKDLKPAKVPLFKYNSNSRATELQVDESNLALINYLKTHPWYRLKFNIFSKEKEAQENLAQYDNIDKALELIKESDKMKLKAIAMAVFGINSFYKTETQCAAELKGKAIKEPSVIIEAMNAPNYQNKFVSGMAFVSGIIKLNPTHTAITWSDDDGLILMVAQGENGLDKLAKYLGDSSENATVLLQEFQARLDKKTNSGPTVDASKELSKANKEIAELKAKLAAATNTSTETKPVEQVEDDADGASGLVLDTEEAKQALLAKDPATMNLAEAQAAYVLKFKKPLPIAYKNKIEWLVAQLTKTE